MAKLETGAPKLEDSIHQQVFTECRKGNGCSGVCDLSGQGEMNTPQTWGRSWGRAALPGEVSPWACSEGWVESLERVF